MKNNYGIGMRKLTVSEINNNHQEYEVVSFDTMDFYNAYSKMASKTDLHYLETIKDSTLFDFIVSSDTLKEAYKDLLKIVSHNEILIENAFKDEQLFHDLRDVILSS